MSESVDKPADRPADVPGAKPATRPPGAPAREDDLRLAEALVFAASDPVTARTLAQVLPADADAAGVIAALEARYAGRGVVLVQAGGGVMFRTALDLAPALRRVVQLPRRLPRAAMETLAVIAYHQPITRPEIEEIRGASLGQATLDALLEAGLIAPGGRRETPGRPTLWGTTPAFLAQFGLNDLRALPRREDLLVEPIVGALSSAAVTDAGLTTAAHAYQPAATADADLPAATADADLPAATADADLPDAAADANLSDAAADANLPDAAAALPPPRPPASEAAG